MSSLEMNKIAASILVAGLIALIVGKATNMLYHVDSHVEKRGYQVAGIDTSENAGGAPKEEEKPVDIAPLMAAADAAAGEAVSKKCTSCHTFDKGGKNGVGPNLHNAVGAKIAGKAGFAFSDALKSKDGNWDAQSLSEWLTNPQKFAKGNKMGFAGLKKPEDRANLIKYLQSLK